MTMRELVPWKWGRLRREDHGQPVDVLRREMDAFQRHMDRLFEDLTGQRGFGFGFPEAWAGENLVPRLDHSEDDKAFYVSVELPGMSEEDVELTLADGMLKIRGEKRATEESKEKDFYRCERSYGAFNRLIEIPGEVDEDRIEANFSKGVLNITLPKSAEARDKVHRIDVKAA